MVPSNMRAFFEQQIDQSAGQYINNDFATVVGWQRIGAPTGLCA
jgi:hypothetical protein